MYVGVVDQYGQHFQEDKKFDVFPYINYYHASASMRENYGHMLIKKLVIGNPTTCANNFAINKSLQKTVDIVQLFIMN